MWVSDAQVKKMRKELHERRSIVFTSNLVFSQRDRIFEDPMTTAAAIDRIVHQAIIIEMVGGSIREDEAQARLEQLAAENSTTPAALEAPARLSVR